MSKHTLQVTGHSDDIIHVEGDRTEEMYVYDTPAHFIVGDTEVIAEYDGEWAFSTVEKDIGDDKTTHYEVGDSEAVDAANEYTEMLVVESDSALVVRLD